MKVVQSWLKRYLTFKITPEQLAERLTMLGLEFEGVERLGEKYRGFVVGKVLEVARHPQADKLTVCRVHVGAETLQIVCGAPNVAAGQKVVVGLVGAIVPKDQHDPSGKPLNLAAVKIRGVDSFGMICSEYELDLGKDAEGILVLGEDARAGQPLTDYLGLDDVVYDIEITPNRPDWLSHVGVAREIGVLVGRAPQIPKVRLRESTTPISAFLSIRVEDRANCLRFAGRMIRGVRIGPSPRWLQNMLRNAGLRPINNVVDVTNFVMLECGHPLHAFDYALLRGNTIAVRQARPGTRFATLDGKEHELPAGTVMVCDAEREVSIAGVMGGANSEINDATVDVVLESAYWNPASIRRTSKALGIVSDASQRFERGADPNAVMYALNRAAQLVVDIAGGSLLKGAIDVYPRKIKERIVPLRPDRANAVLGTSLPRREVIRCLQKLGLASHGTRGKSILFKVPTFRVDLEREIDLIEEVARVHGYDNIEEKTTATIDFVHPFPASGLVGRVRETLIGTGFQEAITNSMQDESKASLGGGVPVRILNPQNQDMRCVRTSLVPGLLDVVAHNHSRGSFDLRLFEVGHVFSVDTTDRKKLVEDYLEEERVCLLVTGQAELRHWSKAPRMCDIFDVRGAVEDLLDKMALDKWHLISYPTSKGLTEDSLSVEIQGSYAGYLGRVAGETLKRFGIGQEVFVAELVLPLLQASSQRRFEPLARFPRVRRDVAFIVPVATSAESVEKAIRGSPSELLQKVELFDVFEGGAVGAGKKSVAFSLELMSRERTLTDSEIDEAVNAIVRQVESGLGATLRALPKE